MLLVVALVQVRPVAAMLGQATSAFHWPGLSVETAASRPVAAVNAKFEWLLSAGSLVLIAGALSAPVLGISLSNAARLYALTLRRLRWAIATVCFVVGLAFVMNLSRQTITLSDAEPNGITLMLGRTTAQPTLRLSNAALGPAMTLG